MTPIEKNLEFDREALVNTDYEKKIFESFLQVIYQKPDNFKFDPIVNYTYKRLGEIVSREEYLENEIVELEDKIAKGETE